MAALPYMPLFVADYLADTAHLSTIQHGAYMLLIMNYWQRGKPLPADDAKLARIVGMSVRNWQQIKAPVVEMFETGNDSGTQILQHHRIDREIDRVASKSLKSKKAAQASVERRFRERSTDAERVLNHTQAHTDKDIPEANASGGELQALDAETVMWRHGKLYLTSHGVKADKAGSLLGKWKRDYGAGLVIEALGRAQREGAIDPVSFITGCLQAKRGRDDYDPDRITV